MHIFDVAIVGGGPGGLMTAYALQRLADRPIRVTIFEASDRLGGKVVTRQFASAPVRYEAGAAEFYDYSKTDEDPLRELIRELGLPVRPMGGPAVVMDDRILSNLDDIRDRLGSAAHDAVVDFDRFAKDRITPQAFYAADDPEGVHTNGVGETFAAVLDRMPDAKARSYIETLIHSDLAAEPEHTSPRYGLQNYVMNDGRYMSLYGIEGGNERLIHALATRLDATIHLETPVRSIQRRSDGRMTVRHGRDGAEAEADYDYVVVALPHNHLASVGYPDDDLAAAMKAHHDYYDHPAHYLRISMLFERPFWRGAFTDSYWMLDQLGGCCLYDESSRIPGCTHGVLGWLLGGATALAMAEKSDAELVEAALDSLPAFLADGRHLLMEAAVQRWPYSVRAIPGGLAPRPLDQRHRPEPLRHPQLFVVGDYLFDTTLNGVLDSAEYVASWLAALTIETHA